ncbi:MAG TPA: hypothetical protein DCL40_00830 [Coxiellaceae bacterium]|nr:hypothetical protein [Coxiellaceae bacterium]
MTPHTRQMLLALSAVSLLFIACYSCFDQALAVWLHQHTLAAITWLAQSISDYFEAQTFYLLPLLIIAYCYFTQRLNTPLCRDSIFLTYIFIINIFICTGLKIVFARARPTEWFHHQTYGFHFFNLNSHYWSFPSGHTFVASTFFSFIAITRPKFRAWCALAIIIMGASRMIVGAHYLGDVIMGAFLGYWTCHIVIKKYQHRLPQRLDNWVQKKQPLST